MILKDYVSVISSQKHSGILNLTLRCRWKKNKKPISRWCTTLKVFLLLKDGCFHVNVLIYVDIYNEWPLPLFIGAYLLCEACTVKLQLYCVDCNSETVDYDPVLVVSVCHDIWDCECLKLYNAKRTTCSACYLPQVCLFEECLDLRNFDVILRVFSDLRVLICCK